VHDLLADDGPFFMYNGDIFTDAALLPALEQHHADGNLVTLLLRAEGPVRNVAVDAASRQVLDLRNARGTNHPDVFQFTGVCIIEPAFFKYLPARGVIESVVAAWLRALDAGERIGGAFTGGQWLDLGDRASYLEAHRVIPCLERVHPTAKIGEGVQWDDACSIGANCIVENCAVLRGSVLWPEARVAAGAQLDNCVVLSGHMASGVLVNADV
jgi:mannose-1-phosphate guanylyltransferase